MKEDFYSTVRENKDGSTTEIRVHIDPEVRGCAEEESSDPEELIQGCVWRFIALKDSEIKGDRVDFLIDKLKFTELLTDLRQIAKATKNCRSLS